MSLCCFFMWSLKLLLDLMLYVTQLILLLCTFDLVEYFSHSELEGRLAPWTTYTWFTFWKTSFRMGHTGPGLGSIASWRMTWCLLRLPAFLNPLPLISQMRVGERCTQKWRRKIFLLENFLS